MNQDEYNLIRQIGTENDYGICFGDIFYLRYCDINVFFYVCKTSSKQVCVYELEKKRIKNNGIIVEILDRKLKGSKKPLIITENNCSTKSDFWVDVKDKEHIWIPIYSELPIYSKAFEMAKDYIPTIGDFEAIKIVDENKIGILNYYWEV